MQGIGAQDTRLAADVYLDNAQTYKAHPTVDLSDQLWSYRFKNTYRSIPVAQQARNLAIDKAQTLQQALQLTATAKVWSGYISPEQQDKRYLLQYQKLKQKQADNHIVITEQDKQFCPALNKFIIIVVYSQVCFTLNSRFQHLRQE